MAQLEMVFDDESSHLKPHSLEKLSIGKSVNNLENDLVERKTRCGCGCLLVGVLYLSIIGAGFGIGMIGWSYRDVLKKVLFPKDMSMDRGIKYVKRFCCDREN